MDIFISFKTAFSLLVDYWWLYLPILLFALLITGYQDYTREKYIASLGWVLLEITLPPDVVKSPKIAENIYSGLHGTYSKPLSWKKKFFEGKVPEWFSLEIVGNGGDIKFYIRCTETVRNLVEAQIFSQYPEAEIKIAEDYVSLVPDEPNEEYDLFGTELMFTKDDAFPIKTYPFFEEESGKDEFVRTDPLAPYLEVLSSLNAGEHIWLQLIIRPTGGEWVAKAKAVVDKMTGKKPEVKEPFVGSVINAIDALISGGPSEAVKKEDKEFSLQKLTPRQKFTLEQVEMKISKLGFKGGHRLIYIAKREAMNKARVPTVIGMFKQLYANDLNTFKPNGYTVTVADGYLAWLFPSNRGFGADQQEYKRKVNIIDAYKTREFVHHNNILNTEELATLWHLPGIGVKAPLLPRVEAVKGQPPAGLPTK
ncbi:MAG: hypothetical protein A2750_03755 [Candidatus Yanofskybacteria bacterium RIFCSPHIGHO2_01_FULL_45_42]|nr:MAG: hypothetical protein A2750_03755 [Candidatus Yanofskybacteria bacterium RIFCSPHIGHO2_01_FULL_45_42]OGN31739.1 MAG: hypothetical protein A3J01_00215 [Candidatus Yanofskybacteria bacterium RIFCSPLOWO2_02_FULL_45_18]